MSGQVPKLGLKYWKLRARKLALHLINVAEINANFNNSRQFHGALISYNKVIHLFYLFAKPRSQEERGRLQATSTQVF